MKKKLCIALLFFIGCGNTSTLQLNLTGSTAFSDTNVTDIVFTFQNEVVNNQFLDQDKDGQPDAFVYPSSCGAHKPAGCGYPAAAGTITVGDLPLGFRYTVLVQLRNSTGTVLHTGQSTFDNNENTQPVTVQVN